MAALGPKRFWSVILACRKQRPDIRLHVHQREPAEMNGFLSQFRMLREKSLRLLLKFFQVDLASVSFDFENEYRALIFGDEV